jgi:hypothetical protein
MDVKANDAPECSATECGELSSGQFSVSAAAKHMQIGGQRPAVLRFFSSLVHRAASVTLGSFLPLAARRMNVSYTSLVLFSLH